MSRSRLLLAVLAAIGVALFAAPALAAPPSLIWFRHDGGRWSASWYLPPGVQTKEIELATRPEVGADGSFLTEYVQYKNVLGPHIAVRVSHFSDQKLKPGRYYFHVSGADEACLATGACPQREWSNVLTLVVAKPRPKHRPVSSTSQRAGGRGGCARTS
jgi:hypothetical protein